VGDLARAFATMQRRLAAQEQSRRTFVSTASHELRTPLTSLGLMLHSATEELTQPEPDVPDARDQLRRALGQTERLSKLAEELLDLSRLDAAVQLRSEPVELGELARAVAAEFELRARELDVEIDVIPPAEGCWGRGDPDAVARVVRILLDNALRYGPGGQVVSVNTTADDGHAAITVADGGPGIPAEEREHIFERFHRGSRAASSGGFGLGLAIGRELAERMGGTLELEPREPGEGASFLLALRIDLPAGSHQSEDPAETPAAEPQAT